ncbi:MAG: threonine aldolase [Planctomycetes bacterium]|nr:threonine aldolase [Planctomycetota bacterium]
MTDPQQRDGTLAQRKALRAGCRRVQGHGAERPADHLERLVAWCREHDIDYDCYGSGALIEDFESKVADLLGFPAARFVPSGKVAQNVAMRVWCERAKLLHFGMHPTSHLEHHEARAYAHLWGMRATLVGPSSSPMLAEHLQTVHEPLGALLTELPIREAGGLLPTWEQLEDLKRATKDRGIRFHLDGARLWECAAHYGKSYAEICAGFDSVYVSFYKGIGALSGSMLLGPEDFIAEAAIWQRRCGAVLFTLLPNVASAAMLLDERLARMGAYYDRTCAIARALEGINGVRVLPREPHTNLVHIFVEREESDAHAARDRVAMEHGVWLFDRIHSADVPGWSRYEWYVGEAACAIEIDELRECFELLVTGAGH